jgi:hypothetical protein
MARGRPFEPGNTFGKGRPRGSRNKMTKAAQELINSRSEPLVTKVIVMALKGNETMLRVLLDRIVPPLRETPVDIGKLPTTTIDDLGKANKQLVKLASSGKLTITEAKGLAELLEKQRRVLETEALEGRVKVLESKI